MHKMLYCKLLTKCWNLKSQIYLEGSKSVIRGIYMNGVSRYPKFFSKNDLFKWFLDLFIIDLWCTKHLGEKASILYITKPPSIPHCKPEWHLISNYYWTLLSHSLNICEWLSYINHVLNSEWWEMNGTILAQRTTWPNLPDRCISHCYRSDKCCGGSKWHFWIGWYLGWVLKTE